MRWLKPVCSTQVSYITTDLVLGAETTTIGFRGHTSFRLTIYKYVTTHTISQLAQTVYVPGIDDPVRCFACDGGLKRWDPVDNPWIEHCRFPPRVPTLYTSRVEISLNLSNSQLTN